MMRAFFLRPVRDVTACLEWQVSILMERTSAKWRVAALLTTVVVTWVVYVPIHELLHAAGCAVWGGEVSRLEISAQYGGTLLAKVFPWVASGSDYAGQLTGFDTRGSDLIYLSTCFAPFLLSVLFGNVLLGLAARRRLVIWPAMGLIIGLAPFYNFPGDYYEMGSIVVTRGVSLVAADGPALAFESLRSDDVIKLISTLVTKPGELGLSGAGAIVKGAAVVFASILTEILLIFATYNTGHLVARAVLRPTTGLSARTAS